MPVRKQDAHRALELLEDYHSRLTKPQDKALKNAIERVIRIFKSRLFQALLDIQEFYEVTLLDDSKTTQQKTLETLQIASKWEREPPITNSQPKFKNNVKLCALSASLPLSLALLPSPLSLPPSLLPPSLPPLSLPPSLPFPSLPSPSPLPPFPSPLPLSLPLSPHFHSKN
ncbi:DLG1 [Acanthosepion pharaonis]|uniref:DLG1 n=1 Tax=Acanthosepion pharaonis TaxID=158019 RepID=A0A812DV16_ACAPH|nr:DLG1 [Sepia pharaonis]